MSLLEAEIVTADGAVRIANACTNPDLFWAMKGGGGGTFGVATRLTMRTHPLPQYFGNVFTMIQALSDATFRRLIGQFLIFYADSLLNPNWGDVVRVRRDNVLVVEMSFQGLDQEQAQAVWQPFLGTVAAAGSDFDFTIAPRIVAMPARQIWDPTHMRARNAGLVDDRPGAPAENLYWEDERSAFLYAEPSKVAPDAGAYVAESSFFEPEWQQAYWGENYAKLLAAKKEIRSRRPFRRPPRRRQRRMERRRFHAGRRAVRWLWSSWAESPGLIAKFPPTRGQPSCMKTPRVSSRGAVGAVAIQTKRSLGHRDCFVASLPAIMALGHEERFPRPRLSRCCQFS